MKFLNIQFIALYIILDVLSFRRRDNTGLFWQLLFSNWRGTNGKKYYYIYRPLQFILFAAGLYFTFITGGVLVSIAYVLSYVLYAPDLWYYVFGLELETLWGYEDKKENTFWLEHWYQIGHYTWKEFSLKQFILFGLLGTVILIISNFI